MASGQKTCSMLADNQTPFQVKALSIGLFPVMEQYAAFATFCPIHGIGYRDIVKQQPILPVIPQGPFRQMHLWYNLFNFLLQINQFQQPLIQYFPCYFHFLLPLPFSTECSTYLFCPFLFRNRLFIFRPKFHNCLGYEKRVLRKTE